MLKTSTKLAFCVALAVMASGCARTKSALGGSQSYSYEGYAYKGKIQRSKEDRADFGVTVRGADRGLSGALEAARIEANRYCIDQYGNTDISWSGPTPDTDPSEISISENGILELRGRCKTW
ncbi:hypothetical protein [Lentibacter sp. XHP0401]|uniref:hypothetical protein n=1 Tax=Lentibacter sp. XHP0401 TaxID=2984334 RepID=UPI0021E75E46|nr:hypothetical protein [Lentibacter sp. XHP0401]MCV2893940.1 hypothetical protein [Lentibacter sp. XHP0401]